MPTTVAQPIVNQFEIEGGVRSGNNLFHSFSQFSVPTGGSVLFNNATDIQNIFSRVTGSQISNIDGILQSQGNANIFLMNPNGIVFAPNASLQLGGSFVGTTAIGIQFADGIEFNATPTTPALLSINVPIGLQFGQNPASITAQNASLSSQSGQGIALIGGAIDLSATTIETQGGTIDLGSVASADRVSLATLSNGMEFELRHGQNIW